MSASRRLLALMRNKFGKITGLGLLKSVAALWVVAALFIPLPYVVFSPGPTTDVLSSYKVKKVSTPYIQISGHETFPSDGELRLTTVSVTNPDYSARALYILPAWISKESVVMPRASIYAPMKSSAAVKEEESAAMTSSQQNAMLAALNYLKYPVTTRVEVAGAIAKTSAASLFKRGDVILSVNGVKIVDISTIKTQLAHVKPGESVAVEYARAGVTQTVKVITASGSGGRALLGVSAGVVPQLPFKIEIAAGEIGGPSAGLLFTLGVVEKLTPGSLAKKRIISGTGTITPEGKVGAIGGIDEKIRGAKRAGATLFLAPLENCKNITVHEASLSVVGVRDVGAAVKYLENSAAIDPGIDRTCGK